MADKLDLDLKALKRLCPEMIVRAPSYERGQIWKLRLRPYNRFNRKDVETIAACIVRLGGENKTLKREKSKTFKEGYNRGLDAAKKVLGYDAGRKERA